MISLDLMKSSEVRKAGDQSKSDLVRIIGTILIRTMRNFNFTS